MKFTERTRFPSPKATLSLAILALELSKEEGQSNDDLCKAISVLKLWRDRGKMVSYPVEV